MQHTYWNLFTNFVSRVIGFPRQEEKQNQNHWMLYPFVFEGEFANYSLKEEFKASWG